MVSVVNFGWSQAIVQGLAVQVLGTYFVSTMEARKRRQPGPLDH